MAARERASAWKGSLIRARGGPFGAKSAPLEGRMWPNFQESQVLARAVGGVGDRALGAQPPAEAGVPEQVRQRDILHYVGGGDESAGTRSSIERLHNGAKCRSFPPIKSFPPTH